MSMNRVPPSTTLFCASLLVLLAHTGCSNSDGHESRGQAPRYGALMLEVGRRFELLGEAADAGRWELAEFELQELEEVFDELALAPSPEESHEVDLQGIREAFLETHPPELASALQRRDTAAFAEAFERAALTCNGCHKASGHAFIEVPTVPGQRVPKLDRIHEVSAR
jgi:hypothetical protein